MTICIRASLIHMKNLSYKDTILGRGPRTYAALLKVSGFLAVPVLWMCVSWSGVVKPLFLPDPIRVIQAAWDIQHPNLFVHTLSTLRLIVSGYALGVVSGYTAGLLLRHSFIVRNFFTPIIETMRPVPAVALIPFFILWFGYSATGKIVLIAAGVFLIIVVGVVNAIDTLDPLYIRSALALGGNNWKFLWHAALPAILPTMLGHMRVALAIAITLAIVSEFMGATRGLGLVINSALNTFSSHTVMLVIIILGMIGSILDAILCFIWSKLTKWPQEAREALL